MIPSLCLWLFISGSFINVHYIKSIQPGVDPIVKSVDQTRTIRTPFFDASYTQPVQVIQSYQGIYRIVIANTASSDSETIFPDTTLKIGNLTHHEDYSRVSNFLTRCS